jgi:hypothetical protein
VKPIAAASKAPAGVRKYDQALGSQCRSWFEVFAASYQSGGSASGSRSFTELRHRARTALPARHQTNQSPTQLARNWGVKHSAAGRFWCRARAAYPSARGSPRSRNQSLNTASVCQSLGFESRARRKSSSVVTANRPERVLRTTAARGCSYSESGKNASGLTPSAFAILRTVAHEGNRSPLVVGSSPARAMKSP